MDELVRQNCAERFLFMHPPEVFGFPGLMWPGERFEKYDHQCMLLFVEDFSVAES